MTECRLREYRTLAGLTVSALARQAGVAERSLHRIEAGDGNPREVTLRKIYNVLITVPFYAQHPPRFEEVFPGVVA